MADRLSAVEPRRRISKLGVGGGGGGGGASAATLVVVVVVFGGISERVSEKLIRRREQARLGVHL